MHSHSADIDTSYPPYVIWHDDHDSACVWTNACKSHKKRPWDHCDSVEKKKDKRKWSESRIQD